MSELEGAGYAVEPLADAPGTASRRGGIIDIYPASAERPFRIEFFGNAACAKAVMADWIDYMQLAKVDGRWVIVNVLWERKPKTGH